MFSLRSTGFARICLLVVLLLGEAVRVSHVTDVRTRTLDEEVYASYAATVAQDGPQRLPDTHRQFLVEANFGIPPPSRIGLPLVAAPLIRTLGLTPTTATAWVACGASLLTLVLLGLMTWQIYGPWIAVVATLCFAVFPPELALARRGWTDAVVGCLAVAAVWAAVRLLRQWTLSGLGVLAVLGIAMAITKEGAALQWIGVVAVLLALRPRRVVSLSIVCAVAGLSTLGVLSLAAGDPWRLWSVVSSVGGGHAGSWYAARYQSGPSYVLIVSLWQLSPSTMAWAGVGLIGLLARLVRRRDDVSLLYATVALAAVLLWPGVIWGWTNLRLTSPAFGPICVLAALGVRDAARLLMRPVGAPVALVVVVCLLAVGLRVDYARCLRAVVTADVQDMAPQFIAAALK